MGYGTHFRVRIASPLFAGRSRVAQHRLVYDALQDFFAPNKQGARGSYMVYRVAG